jgi:hypothetical protein
LDFDDEDDVAVELDKLFMERYGELQALGYGVLQVESR